MCIFARTVFDYPRAGGQTESEGRDGVVNMLAKGEARVPSCEKSAHNMHVHVHDMHNARVPTRTRSIRSRSLCPTDLLTDMADLVCADVIDQERRSLATLFVVVLYLDRFRSGRARGPGGEGGIASKHVLTK